MVFTRGRRSAAAGQSAGDGAAVEEKTRSSRRQSKRNASHSPAPEVEDVSIGTRLRKKRRTTESPYLSKRELERPRTANSEEAAHPNPSDTSDLERSRPQTPPAKSRVQPKRKSRASIEEKDETPIDTKRRKRASEKPVVIEITDSSPEPQSVRSKKGAPAKRKSSALKQSVEVAPSETLSAASPEEKDKHQQVDSPEKPSEPEKAPEPPKSKSKESQKPDEPKPKKPKDSAKQESESEHADHSAASSDGKDWAGPVNVILPKGQIHRRRDGSPRASQTSHSESEARSRDQSAARSEAEDVTSSKKGRKNREKNQVEGVVRSKTKGRSKGEPAKKPKKPERLSPAQVGTLMEEVRKYCLELDDELDAKHGYQNAGSSGARGYADDDGMREGKAPIKLQKRALKALDELAIYILCVFAMNRGGILKGELEHSQTELGRIYANIKGHFENVKMLFPIENHFIPVEKTKELDEGAKEAVQRANLATFVLSSFGSGEVGFFMLDKCFIDVFIISSDIDVTHLKRLGHLFCELKTQAFISASSNKGVPQEEIINDLFNRSEWEGLLSRRLGSKNGGKDDQLKSFNWILQEQHYNMDKIAQSLRDGQSENSWHNYLKKLTAYIESYFSHLAHKSLQDIVPYQNSGFFSSSPYEPRYPPSRRFRKSLVGNEVAPLQSVMNGQAASQGGQLPQGQHPPLPAETPQAVPGQPNGPQGYYPYGSSLAAGQPYLQQTISNAQPSPYAPYPSQSPKNEFAQGEQQALPLPESGRDQPSSEAEATSDKSKVPTFFTDVIPPNQSQPTSILYERARAVANARFSGPTYNRSKTHTISHRRPWTTEEEQALMAGLDTVKGPHWSQILALHGHKGSRSEILKGRSQVQLKDKARNLKLFFLKSNIEVPYYLQLVTGELKKQQALNGQREDGDGEYEGEEDDVIFMGESDRKSMSGPTTSQSMPPTYAPVYGQPPPTHPVQQPTGPHPEADRHRGQYAPPPHQGAPPDASKPQIPPPPQHPQHPPPHPGYYPSAPPPPNGQPHAPYAPPPGPGYAPHGPPPQSPHQHHYPPPPPGPYPPQGPYQTPYGQPNHPPPQGQSHHGPQPPPPGPPYQPGAPPPGPHHPPYGHQQHPPPPGPPTRRDSGPPPSPVGHPTAPSPGQGYPPPSPYQQHQPPAGWRGPPPHPSHGEPYRQPPPPHHSSYPPHPSHPYPQPPPQHSSYRPPPSSQPPRPPSPPRHSAQPPYPQHSSQPPYPTPPQHHSQPPPHQHSSYPPHPPSHHQSGYPPPQPPQELGRWPAPHPGGPPPPSPTYHPHGSPTGGPDYQRRSSDQYSSRSNGQNGPPPDLSRMPPPPSPRRQSYPGPPSAPPAPHQQPGPQQSPSLANTLPLPKPKAPVDGPAPHLLAGQMPPSTPPPQESRAPSVSSASAPAASAHTQSPWRGVLPPPGNPPHSEARGAYPEPPHRPPPLHTPGQAPQAAPLPSPPAAPHTSSGAAPPPSRGYGVLVPPKSPKTLRSPRRPKSPPPSDNSRPASAPKASSPTTVSGAFPPPSAGSTVQSPPAQHNAPPGQQQPLSKPGLVTQQSASSAALHAPNPSPYPPPQSSSDSQRKEWSSSNPAPGISTVQAVGQPVPNTLAATAVAAPPASQPAPAAQAALPPAAGIVQEPAVPADKKAAAEPPSAAAPASSADAPPAAAPAPQVPAPAAPLPAPAPLASASDPPPPPPPISAAGQPVATPVPAPAPASTTRQESPAKQTKPRGKKRESGGENGGKPGRGRGGAGAKAKAAAEAEAEEAARVLREKEEEERKEAERLKPKVNSGWATVN